MTAAVVCEALTVRRGSVLALQGVDLEIPRAAVTVVLGPNGAGKSTLVDTIVGALVPSQGTVRTLGHDPGDDRAELSQRWSVMPQTGGLPMGVTVAEAVQLFADLWSNDIDTEAVIDLVGLRNERDRKWRRLSGGQQQRLSLAVTLVGGSELMILDEPTASVDPQGRDRLLTLLAARARDGAAVVVTTHELEVVAAVADNAVLLGGGRVLAAEPVEDITAADGIDVKPGNVDYRPLADELGCPLRRPARLDLAPTPHNLSLVAAAAERLGMNLSAIGAASNTLEGWYRTHLGEVQ